ncbi:type II toxin-antitoxin system PemK/MazF family toxin [Leptolyngbya sp. CCNP1308]|uniref:type II toxin-antitoxin system PemK/MazF family toxin n=1 Tax=Leptolyngbya sp. CCNP1308 TaxID=3110255 RepID=UPI002B2010A6|nr:type II toxin-antitoxin system PemK/MazF family toxin [Leptolyngbya sp. CCNP1308]MEA5452691.1 type II toxin-antitoxin system PemK/MazF family toxin [Leptolyngbya sp. CCNP1308]
MTYEFGEVVLVPFPFTNQNAQKKRPSVVISSGEYNAARPDLILIAVTSQVKTPLLFGEIMISDWQTAGLLKLSVIKPVITTVQKDLVIKKLGKLMPTDLQLLEELLGSLFKPVAT